MKPSINIGNQLVYIHTQGLVVDGSGEREGIVVGRLESGGSIGVVGNVGIGTVGTLGRPGIVGMNGKVGIDKDGIVGMVGNVGTGRVGMPGRPGINGKGGSIGLGRDEIRFECMLSSNSKENRPEVR